MLRRVTRRAGLIADRLSGKQFVHFLHVSKAGGSAVKDAIEGRLRTPTSRIFLHPHRTTLMDVPRGEKVFFFLRDPVTRFVSGFNSRLRQGRPRYDTPWTPDEARAFARFGTPDALASALSDEKPEVREAARDAMRVIGHVRSSYWQWLGDEAQLARRLDDVLFVGRQESLARDFEALRDLLGLPASLTLPEAHRTPEGFDRRLSPQAVENLREWYASDYHLLELCARHGDRIHYRVPEGGA
jgi:Sulfotransferase family